jgi:hypothetical protein
MAMRGYEKIGAALALPPARPLPFVFVCVLVCWFARLPPSAVVVVCLFVCLLSAAPPPPRCSFDCFFVDAERSGAPGVSAGLRGTGRLVLGMVARGGGRGSGGVGGGGGGGGGSLCSTLWFVVGISAAGSVGPLWAWLHGRGISLGPSRPAHHADHEHPHGHPRVSLGAKALGRQLSVRSTRGYHWLAPIKQWLVGWRCGR